MTEAVMNAVQDAAEDNWALKKALWRLFAAVVTSVVVAVLIILNPVRYLDYWLVIAFGAVFWMFQGSWDSFKKWKQPGV